ncbi:unnamed protein product [Orchesella dallaii]|uniref:RNB domain-containing protein n=1 Tax=Orchesella dallaii TaxID=48710 RepID=A0ABP1QB47_9HEXA
MITTDAKMTDLSQYGCNNKKLVREVITYRQNRKGKPLKISREKYLRSDINCGSYGCQLCPMNERSRFKLDEDPPIHSQKFNFKHYLLPDVGFILRQVDVVDELGNVILLQSVMEEVWRKNVTKYKRIRDGTKLKKWMYFLNDHHCDTYLDRHPDETVDERNIRALVHCYEYFSNHFASRKIKLVILSDDPEFRKCLKIENSDSVLVATGEEYVMSLTEEFKGLEDKLCRVPFNEDEVINKYNKGDFEYPPHLDPVAVQNGIKTGKYFQGPYRNINFYEGSVRIGSDIEEPAQKKRKGDEINLNEILLQGLEHINRASEGDIVAIEILPEDKWSVPSGIVIVEPAEHEPPLTDDKIVVDKETADPDARDEEYRQEEEEILEAVIKSNKSVQQKRRTGKVVGIIRRKWKPCCGVIQRSLKHGSNFHMFLPDNKKLPRVRIETRNVDRFDGKKIVVQIDQWPITSRFPIGHYIKILGDAGTIETETQAILHEHGIPHDPFSKAVEACLPTLPYTIDPEEYTKRKDFRDLVICSVDPEGCTDIDDALHCKKLDDEIYEVGVHIADVSYYVRPETALDEEAAKRSTTVYLADRRIHMIPGTLSTTVASLHCKEDKLVFSVVWKMDKNAQILDTKFYKGIMNSKAAMTYAEAQSRLNSKTANDEISVSLKGLSYLAQILRKRRFDNGALMLSGGEVSDDGEVEDDCEESHAMVEEFMLLANCSVAQFVLNTFREYALLRRHPTPPPANFEPLLLAAKAHNISIDVDKGSKALNESLERQPPELKSILRVLTTRCMTQALYCCSGTTAPDEYHHFGLAADIYTHFTSPIRRYADLIVHRLLAIALEVEAPNQKILDPQRIHASCENINIRHRMAQYASRASYNIHKCKMLKGKKEVHLGYIMFVRRNALQIFVPKYAMEGFIFFPKDAIYEYNEKDGEVKFGSVSFRPLDKVTIGLSLEEKKDKVVFRLLKPEVPGLSDQPDQ